MNTRWQKNTAPHAIGDKMFLGKWWVGAAYYDGARGRDDPKKYVAVSMLPGVKRSLGYYMTIEDAKTRVESATEYWLDNIDSRDADKDS